MNFIKPYICRECTVLIHILLSYISDKTVMLVSIVIKLLGFMEEKLSKTNVSWSRQVPSYMVPPGKTLFIFVKPLKMCRVMCHCQVRRQ